MADGAQLDREVVLATTGADFEPLLDLGPATVEVRTERPGVVDVVHRGGPLVVGLQVTDDRPADAAPLLIDGDPRPLLPGEHRSFAVRGAGPARVRLEGWNVDPFLLDVEPIKEWSS